LLFGCTVSLFVLVTQISKPNAEIADIGAGKEVILSTPESSVRFYICRQTTCSSGTQNSGTINFDTPGSHPLTFYMEKDGFVPSERTTLTINVEQVQISAEVTLVLGGARFQFTKTPESQIEYWIEDAGQWHLFSILV
jgi:hypothetical protein